MAEQKTNAMRILDQMKIPYGTIYYEVEGEFTNGNDVAKKTGVPEDQDFKTLVAQGKSERYCVFVIPVSHEMDMKKAARSVGEKSVDLIIHFLFALAIHNVVPLFFFSIYLL